MDSFCEGNKGCAAYARSAFILGLPTRQNASRYETDSVTLMVGVAGMSGVSLKYPTAVLVRPA